MVPYLLLAGLFNQTYERFLLSLLPFLATFLFDALVTCPRTRILLRHELENTSRAKADYLKRTMNLIARGMPFLDEDCSG